MSKPRHVVYGAGPLGRAVARAAREAGHELIIASRAGLAPVAGAAGVRSDATDAASVRDVCAGTAVIYNCAQPPYQSWPQLFPPIQAGLIEGAAAVGAKLVGAENLYMYGTPTGPLHEDLPYTADTRKGEVRARMAEALQEAHRCGRVRTTAGRASDFYGAEVKSSFMGAPLLRRVLTGGQVFVLGDPDCPHTYTYVEDFARALVTLAEQPAADGQAWHVPSGPTLTTRQFLDVAGQIAKRSVRLRRTPSAAVHLAALVNGMAREVREMLYEFERPFVVDHSKFERAFGAQPTPHEDALRRTLLALAR